MVNIKELSSLFNWWNGISREMLGVFSVFWFDLLFCSQGGLGRLWTRLKEKNRMAVQAQNVCKCMVVSTRDGVAGWELWLAAATQLQESLSPTTQE